MKIRWLVGFIVGTIVSTSVVWAQGTQAPLTLEESIKIVMERSLTLNSAVIGVVGSEFRRKEAITNFLPLWTGQYSYTKWSYPAIIGNLGGNLTGLSQNTNSNVYNFQYDTHSATFYGRV